MARQAQTREPGFIRRADLPAIVGEFLSTVRLEDLVIELVQNELDANSSATHIAFTDDALVCQGNGKRIDALGWQRLETIVGAGGSVPAKEGGIGAKNHGLRTAFLIGDDIIVQSAKHRIKLSLFEDAERRELDPGAWPRAPDAEAPATGVRITVPYRRAPVAVPGAQGFSLAPLPRDRLEALYRAAVEEAPRRFIAAAVLAGAEGWTLTLACLGQSTTYQFRAASPRRRGKAAPSIRECRRLATNGTWTVVLREQFHAFSARLGADDPGNVPRPFRRGGRIVGDVAWSIDRRGRPVPSDGKMRYPIAYPDTDSDAHTHHGFHVTAPFISDTARHGVAQNAARNNVLLEQARDAFIDVLRTWLIPQHGAEALRLIQRPSRPNPALEEGLIAQALQVGALPVEALRPGARSSKRHQAVDCRRDWRVAIASFSKAPLAIDRHLFWLAAEDEQILSLQLPDFAVKALLNLAHRDAASRERIRHCTEQRAIQALAPPDGDERRQANSALTPAQLERSVRAVRTLQHCRSRHGLPEPSIKELRDRGLLPTRSGRERPWKSVWYSRGEAPVIDGTAAPALLHEALLDLRILREGALKLEPFRINTYVARLDFSKGGAPARTNFFRWLTRHRSGLKPSTLATLAKQPFWPTADGRHVPLDALCVPNRRELRSALADVLTAPAADVLAQRWLTRPGRGSVALRRIPTSEEIGRWYSAHSTRLSELDASGDTLALRTASLEFDRGLAVLHAEPALWALVKPLALAHRTASRAGTLALAADLHLPTAAVEACALQAGDLVAGRFAALYRALGAHPMPAAAALRRALLADPRRDVLFVRLGSYASTGLPLEGLENAPIIPTGEGVAAPATLALPLQRDLWGRWRRTWAPSSPTPEHIDLLMKAGVAGRSLTEKLSRGFFAWLSSQPSAVQEAHTAQVLRHFHDRQRGPLKWRSGAMVLPCIPVRGKRAGVHLVSFAQATKPGSKVCLPDFPQLHDQILKRDAARMLVITNVEGVQGTILAELRRLGVPSLRQTLGRPKSLSVNGEIVTVDESLRSALRTLRSERMAEQLPKRLELHGIASDSLHRNWRGTLSRLKDVRYAPHLVATYALGVHEYQVHVSSAASAAGDVIYLRETGDPAMAFYQALAELLFADLNPLAAYGLRCAVEQPFDPDVRRSGAPADIEPDDAPNPAPSQTPPIPRPGHGLSAADLVPRAPDPKPFAPSRIAPPPPPPPGPPAPPMPTRVHAPAATAHLRQSVAEQEQIRQLKEEHYACHCQACLGSYEVAVATPPHTYVSVDKYRRANLQVHHVDHLQNGGDLGARNLLVLCSFHHDLLGDRMNGAAVRSALATATPAARHFPTPDGKPAPIKGVIATVSISMVPWNVSLFFTSDHAAIWRSIVPTAPLSATRPAGLADGTAPDDTVGA